jgi:hypothetical protein
LSGAKVVGEGREIDMGFDNTSNHLPLSLTMGGIWTVCRYAALALLHFVPTGTGLAAPVAAEPVADETEAEADELGGSNFDAPMPIPFAPL